MLPGEFHGFENTGFANESSIFSMSSRFDMLEGATSLCPVLAYVCRGCGNVVKYACRFESSGASSPSSTGPGNCCCAGPGAGVLPRSRLRTAGRSEGSNAAPPTSIGSGICSCADPGPGVLQFSRLRTAHNIDMAIHASLFANLAPTLETKWRLWFLLCTQ